MTSNLPGDPRDFFKPEFFNRIDEIVRFRALRPEDLRRITDIQLAHLEGRLAERRLALEVTAEARARRWWWTPIPTTPRASACADHPVDGPWPIPARKRGPFDAARGRRLLPKLRSDGGRSETFVVFLPSNLASVDAVA
jgi:hypothetical protein